MNIYFSGSIKWADDAKHLYPHIINECKKYGIVLTEHIGQKITPQNNIADTPQWVFQADKKLLDQADIVVAEITAPSLWVWWELCYAQHRQLPIHCLYHQDKNISRMITGNDYINFYPYSTNTLTSHIQNIFSHS